MPDIKMPLEYRVDVRAPLTIQPLVTLLMEGDAQANELRVSLFDGETPLDLSGLSVGGSFTRADGAEVPITGSVEGNVVKAVLDEYCYAVPGPFGLYVQLLDSLGDVKRTVLLTAGYVHERGHGPVIDTGIALPSLDDILAQLETMKNVTNAANQAASGANAAAGNADAAAGRANEAAGTANSAATNAEAAAGRANEAAGKWDESSAKKLGQRIDNLVGSDTQTAKNADLFGGKPPEYYLPAVNLLDNSDWRVKENIINQRGQESYKGNAIYTIDRWQHWGDTPVGVAINDGYLTVGNAISQTIIRSKIGANVGAAFTVGVMLGDGLVVSSSFNIPNVGETIYVIGIAVQCIEDKISITLPSGSYRYAFLYPGIYTAETLPPFVPHPYAVELAECQRYLWGSKTGFNASGAATADGTQFDILFTLPQPMIDNGKTISIVPNESQPYATLRGASPYDKRIDLSRATILKDHGNIVVIRAPLAEGSATANDKGFVYYDYTFWLSKDL